MFIFSDPWQANWGNGFGRVRMLTFQGTCIHGGCYSANVLGCEHCLWQMCGWGVLLGRMLRSCTRFQVFARMTCCWSEKSCCYVSKTRASMARNDAKCILQDKHVIISYVIFTIPPVPTRKTLGENTIISIHCLKTYEKKRWLGFLQ